MSKLSLLEEFDIGTDNKGFLGAECVLDQAGVKVFEEKLLDGYIFACSPQVLDLPAARGPRGDSFRRVVGRGLILSDQEAIGGERIAADSVVEARSGRNSALFVPISGSRRVFTSTFPRYRRGSKLVEFH